MVMMRSPAGINPERAFRKVVFPEPVPPLTKMLYPAFTSFSRKSAASSVMLPPKISRSISKASGNFRMVRVGPSRAAGGSTTWTRDPSSSRASAMGCAKLTVRFTRLTTC